MQLITKSIENKLKKHPLYSQENNENPEIIVKFFAPCGTGTWYITEGERQPDGDWLLFGLCCLHDAELGYVLLSDLQNQRLPYGLTIERDRHFSGTMADARKEANYLYNC
jgi:hypothetical protein